MANIYAEPVDNLIAGVAGPVSLVDGVFVGARVKVLAKKVTLAAAGAFDVNNGDTIIWGELPKGALPLFGVLVASATMGASATLDMGFNGAAAALRAAAVFTAADTPTFYGKASGLLVPLTAKKKLQSVIAVADLPTSGTLINMLFYSLPEGG